MKVHVSYTTTVGDFYRRAINFHYGKAGLATRNEVKRYLRDHGSQADDILIYELQQAIERGDEPNREVW